MIEKEIYGEAAMELFGESLAPIIRGLGSVHLNGNLGMGKTTLVRGLLKGLGFVGAVKSPTYTLVEPYDLEDLTVYHFDLYRVSDPEELEFMGVRDYFQSHSVCVVEWPDMGGDVLPVPDLIIHLDVLRNGRKLLLEPLSPSAEQALASWQQKLAS
jgi:tRNA threonylcarbamoyladenosine biosynthesis protein TsaE